ncbi:MAG: carboxypeptidase regulatory-like domain-containing protein [Planctomycetaceae bacterium]|nr:MAG: carboxypeptidase regulatory-like domain-containing protein [Planctomycetaceae bacterium]
MNTLWRCAFLLVLVSVYGCGGGAVREPTVPVTGVVTYNGEPVEGATVAFGAASGQDRPASGTTDGAGRFSLTTYAQDDGAIPGKFTVAVSKTRTIGGMTEDEEHAAVEAGKEIEAPTTIDELPERYKDGLKSGLHADVEADRENHFEFDLTD